MKTIKFKLCTNNTYINMEGEYYALCTLNGEPDLVNVTGEELKTLRDTGVYSGCPSYFKANNGKFIGYMPFDKAERELYKRPTDVPKVLKAGSYFIYAKVKSCVDTFTTHLSFEDVPADTLVESIHYDDWQHKYSFDADYREATRTENAEIISIYKIDISKAYNRVSFISDGYGYSNHSRALYKPLSRKEIFDTVTNAYNSCHGNIKDFAPSKTELLSLIRELFKENPIPSGFDAEKFVQEKIVSRPVNITIRNFRLEKDDVFTSGMYEYLNSLRDIKLYVSFRSNSYSVR